MPAGAGIMLAVYALLRSDNTLRGLLATDVLEGSPTMPAVYNHVPQPSRAEDSTPFPYVVIGDDTSIEYGADDTSGEDTTITLHIFDRREDRLLAKQVRDAVKACLHDCNLQVPGTNTILCLFEGSDTIPDPEPLVQHEAIRFRVLTLDS